MRFKQSKWAAVSALVALVAVATWLSVLARASEAPAYTSYASGDFFFPPYASDADRMGFGGAAALYNPALRTGWYYDWGANPNPPHPGGAEYARLIGFTVNTNSCGMDKIPASQRSQVVESITSTALIDNLQANPGALWLIGNEPDSIYNCSPIMPELYAELYHEFYTFIKTYDPSARVAIGAIVQPSPLRLKYLDKVLNHYQTTYGQKLPTALWNIHDYAFREVVGSYGASVPPGASSNVGWTYDLLQWMDVNLWVQNLRAMRQWMADRGERDKPLIITEFGQVVPEGYIWNGFTFTPEVSRDILQASITRFLTETDALVGYPADGNRLVQFWAWYPLYDNYYGGDLVNADGSLTLAGTAFAQIAAQRFAPYRDLYAVPLVTPSMPIAANGLVTVTVRIENHGNAPAQSVPVRFARYGYASGQLLDSTLVTVSQVPGRYGGIQPQVSAQWAMAPYAQYTLTVEIDPARVISQSRRSAQKLSYRVDFVPDLALTLLAVDLPTPFMWTKPTASTIAATVSNMTYLTSLASLVTFKVLGVGGTVYIMPDIPVLPLAPNAAVAVTSTLMIPAPGLYVITATVQPGGLDLNSQNNTAMLNFLAATSQMYLPLALRAGPKAAWSHPDEGLEPSSGDFKTLTESSISGTIRALALP